MHQGKPCFTIIKHFCFVVIDLCVVDLTKLEFQDFYLSQFDLKLPV